MVVRGVLLTLHPTVVEVAEVGHDDGHGQRNREHAGDGAHGAHQLSPNRLWVHVAVADRRHGHHSPPEGLGDAGESGFRTVHFRKVDGARKDYDSDEEEEDQQGELSQTGLQGLAQNLEALRVTRQFEDPEDPHQPDDPDEGQGNGGLRAFILRQLGAQRDEIGNDGEEVDGVHDVLEEVHLARSTDEAHAELKGEPADADGLHDEEGVLEGVEDRWDQDGFVCYGGMRDGGESLEKQQMRGKVVTALR